MSFGPVRLKWRRLTIVHKTKHPIAAFSTGVEGCWFGHLAVIEVIINSSLFKPKCSRVNTLVQRGIHCPNETGQWSKHSSSKSPTEQLKNQSGAMTQFRPKPDRVAVMGPSDSGAWTSAVKFNELKQHFKVEWAKIPPQQIEGLTKLLLLKESQTAAESCESLHLCFR